MRKLLSFILVFALILSGCAQNQAISSSESSNSGIQGPSVENVVTDDTTSSSVSNGVTPIGDIPIDQIPIADGEDADRNPYDYEISFESLDNADLLTYVEDNIYDGLVEQLNSDGYFVENVSAVYVSQEYIDELAFNSQSNIFFGYTLSELDEVFQGTRYVFTLGDQGDTVVKAFEGYDDTYEKVIRNVAMGTGVILICVTVSVVSGGVGAPAVSMIFAAGAKTGTAFALSSGAISAVAAGVTTGIQTKDFEEAKKAAALAGSESFKWGAILGAVAGGASEAIALKGATLNGLTMNEAAVIQKESKYPVEIIKQFHTTEEYEAIKAANLQPYIINGQTALIRPDIDLNLVDELGRTNLQRMSIGLSPLDANGMSFELHHIGQKADATLAILTQAEHDNAALHGFKAISEIDRLQFAKQRKLFWKAMAKLLESGGIA